MLLDCRYWNIDLWRKLFSNDSDVAELQSLRPSFWGYMCSNREPVGKLNQLLAKQKASYPIAMSYDSPNA
jgi:checkpoint serine/threonine-protein kinase